MMRRFAKSYVPLAAIAALLLFGAVPHLVSAAPTTVTAYQAQLPVKLDGSVGSLEWNDTTSMTDHTSGMTFAVKYNTTGWMFLMQWSTSNDCKDANCFGGIEIAPTTNTQAMGSPSAPTLMILASPSLSGNVDEFISTGFSTPVTVESKGYADQTVCGLAQAGNQYTAECYRPFSLNNPSPYDFPNLGSGSTIEIGFAVGEFVPAGLHLADQMTTYVLSFSSQTYGTFTTSTSSTTTSSTTSSSATGSATGSNTTSSSGQTTSSQSTATTTSSSSATTTHSTTKSTTHTTSTSTTTPAGPSVTDYSLELALIVIGFSLFIVVLTMRYQRS